MKIRPGRWRYRWGWFSKSRKAARGELGWPRLRRLGLEALECRRMLSIGPYPDLPGLHLVDPRPDQFEGQIIYLDFDGAEDVTYNGPVTVKDIDVPTFRLGASLAGQKHTVISEVLAQLAATFPGAAVSFTVDRPIDKTPYSTVFIGGNDDAFKPYGSFLGLAEEVDVGNHDTSDKAFVFTDCFASWSEDGYPTVIADTIAHEVGHLLGFVHDKQSDSAASPLADVAATEQLIANGSFSQSGANWVLSGAFYADTTHSRWHTWPGYAYVSGSDGYPDNNLYGTMYQQLTIPANASSVALTYWYNITSEEAGGTAYDFLNVTIQDSSGNYLASVGFYSNVNKGTLGVYHQASYDLTRFKGQTIKLNFLGTTDGSFPTVFRIDDVSVIANTPAQQVTPTMYVHEGSQTGPLLSGVLVTGHDGAGQTFSATTNSNGYVALPGTPGGWQFTIQKAGYTSKMWTQTITQSGTWQAYFDASQTTDEYWLAKVIASEAGSVWDNGSWVRCSDQERDAVGWTVLNRLQSGQFGETIEQVAKDGFAYGQEPTTEISALAAALLNGGIIDLTGGATYFFSPIGMPKEGEPTSGYDVGGGLHEVSGISARVYFPSWAKPKEGQTVAPLYETVANLQWVSALPNVQDKYFMFYRPATALPATYSRQSAVGYAQKYANYVCSDGLFFEQSYPPSNLGAMTPVPTAIGYDCAHFVSCSIGNEPHESGGGLDVPSRAGAYGEPGANKLANLLVEQDYAIEKNSVNDLSPGDVIAYDWDGNGAVNHVALYLGNEKIAAHSASYLDESWNVYQSSHPNFQVQFLHIISGETPQDTTPPTISHFEVIPSSGIVGQTFTITYTVADTGGLGLDHVELWRTNTYPIWPGPGQYEDTKLASGNGPVPDSFSNTIMSAGDWYYGIHVVDKAGNRTTETQGGWQPIHVTVDNVAPSVNAGPDKTVNEGSTLTSSGSFSDPGSDTWTATVNYGDGSGTAPLTLSGKSFNLGHVYPDNGSYTVTVLVSDDYGASGSDSMRVTVNNVAPSVNAGPDKTVNEGSTFASSGSFSDPGSDTWTATVNYGAGSGTAPLTLFGKSFNLNHVYPDDGSYTVTVRVTDDEGAVGTDTLLVTVEGLVLPTLHWDGSGDGNWGDIEHWVDSGGIPLGMIPDETADVVVRDNTVTVAADSSARNLTVESGAILVGAGNTLTVEGDMELAGEAEYVSEVNGTANGLIAAAGNVTLGGTLNIQPAGVGNVNPSDPGNNIGDHTYTLLDTGPDGSVLGKFTTEPPLDDPATPGLREDQLGLGVFNLEKPTYVGRSDPDNFMEPATGVTAKLFIATGGDGNGDGYVDVQDINTLVANFGADPGNMDWTDGDTAGGDADRGDGYVDVQDINILVANFGIAPSPDPGPAAAATATAEHSPPAGEHTGTVDENESLTPRAAEQDSCPAGGTVDALLSSLAWIEQFEQTDPQSRPSEKGSPAAEAVDVLLASYWP